MSSRLWIGPEHNAKSLKKSQCWFLTSTISDPQTDIEIFILHNTLNKQFINCESYFFRLFFLIINLFFYLTRHVVYLQKYYVYLNTAILKVTPRLTIRRASGNSLRISTIQVVWQKNNLGRNMLLTY